GRPTSCCTPPRRSSPWSSWRWGCGTRPCSTSSSPEHSHHGTTGAGTMADILTLHRNSGTTRRHRVGEDEVAELVRQHGLAGLVRPASQHTVEPDGVGQRVLPTLAELRSLLPGGGLRRGATV